MGYKCPVVHRLDPKNNFVASVAEQSLNEEMASPWNVIMKMRKSKQIALPHSLFSAHSLGSPSRGKNGKDTNFTKDGIFLFIEGHNSPLVHQQGRILLLKKNSNGEFFLHS